MKSVKPLILTYPLGQQNIENPSKKSTFGNKDKKVYRVKISNLRIGLELEGRLLDLFGLNINFRAF